MKKAIVIIAALMAVTAVAGAQEKKVSFGIKAEANLTDVKLSDLKGLRSSFNPGASLGGFVRVMLSEHLSLQPELRLSYSEAKVKCGAERFRFKYGSLEIPVYLQGHVKAGGGEFLFGAGPYIGYGLSADTRMENVCDQELKYSDAIELDHFFAGGGVVAGYEFGMGISVNVGYRMAFDVASRHKSSGSRTRAVSLGAAYRF